MSIEKLFLRSNYKLKMSVGIGHVTLGHDPAGSCNKSPTWSVKCWDSLDDQVDHLILLPERALTMDSGWLQADLAEILAHSVIGQRGQQPDSWSRRRSLDWSLVNGHPSSVVAIATSRLESCSTAAAPTTAAAIDAVERSKVQRERHNEERQRKLDELKQHALATQKFREQQEEDRRRRMEEQRVRDVERRAQVEERKKAIMEAERERREAMLRRSEDRGMRQEIKRRNERGSIAFAFGSSTPRMLEPVDSLSSYWGSRRATSTTNVMSASSHGRVTMSETITTASNGANKQRASSVFGLDQNQGDDLMTQSTSAVQGGRRKRTDLLPTMPVHRMDGDRSPRSPNYYAISSSATSSSRGSVARSTGLRSGDITPSSPTRPSSALSQVSNASTAVASSTVSGHSHVRARTAPAGGRKPRPISIAGTGMSLSEAARANRASRESVNTIQRDVSHRERSKETKDKENEKARQAIGQPARPARARSADMRKDNNNVQAQQQAAKSPEAAQPKRTRDARTPAKDAKSPVKSSEPARKQSANKAKPAKTEEPKREPTPPVEEPVPAEIVVKVEEIETVVLEAETVLDAVSLELEEPVPAEVVVQAIETPAPEVAPTESSGATTPSEGSVSGDGPSQSSRKIISSEEEAKAALAEKRRLAREQMEREAERERLRLEEEERLEEERLRQEELEQRLFEEEMDRLALEARKSEEERLQKAIEETQRQLEEARLQREEEARQRAEKEVQDRKAREEAERARKENEERLRREEEERQERRKRVEAIMARTRGKSGGPGKGANDASSTGSSLSVNDAGMTNSISQPDLLGDIVNKTNGDSQTSPDTGKNNGFHIDANSSPTSDDVVVTSCDLPDISNVIANSAVVDAINNLADEHVELVA